MEREKDPVIEAYKAGIDRTLLRENLRRSVTERFEQLRAMAELREAFRIARERKNQAKPR